MTLYFIDQVARIQLQVQQILEQKLASTGSQDGSLSLAIRLLHNELMDISKVGEQQQYHLALVH